jgi:hypothetical protein
MPSQLQPLLAAWLDKQLAGFGTWVDRQLQQEDWRPLGSEQVCVCVCVVGPHTPWLRWRVVLFGGLRWPCAGPRNAAAAALLYH